MLSANSTIDMQPELFPEPTSTIIKVLFVLVSMFGILANLKVIYIITRFRDIRTPLTILLMNLSIADLVAGLSTYFMVFVDVSKTSIRGKWANVLCTFTTAMILFFIASCVSVLTLSAISFSRLIVIKYPMKPNLKLTTRRSITFAVTSWFVSLLLLAPNATTVRYEEDTGFCYRYYPPWMNTTLYSAITIFVGTVLPVSLMTMTYIVAWRHLWKQRAPDATPQLSLRPRKKIMLMLGLLILTYILCWTPFYVYWTMVSALHFYDDTTQDKINLFRFYRIAALFALCNSALDPIIYTLSGEQFKNALCRLKRSNRVRKLRIAPGVKHNGKNNKNLLFDKRFALPKAETKEL